MEKNKEVINNNQKFLDVNSKISYIKEKIKCRNYQDNNIQIVGIYKDIISQVITILNNDKMNDSDKAKLIHRMKEISNTVLPDFQQTFYERSQIFNLGKALLMKKQYDDAIYYLTHADPKVKHESLTEKEYISLSFTLLQLGNAYYRRNNNEEDTKMAIEYYRQLIDSPCKEKLIIIESKENLILSYYNTAEILFEKKDKIEDAKALLEEAIIYLNEQKEKLKSTWKIYNLLGAVYTKLRIHSIALDCYKNALNHFKKKEKKKEKYPDTCATIYQHIGRSQFFLNQYEDAKESYKKGVKEKPNDTIFASIYVELGKTHHQIKEYLGAEKYYKEAIEQKECDINTIVYACIGLGDLYLDMHKYDDCINILNQAINQSKDEKKVMEKHMV